ncbi:predicted protein, partial [Nematostella vectensis]
HVTIQAAIDEFHKNTCLRFKARTTETDWVLFIYKSRCWSKVGLIYWKPGYQEVSLGPGCNVKGIVIHELMHAIGFWHEHRRPDRDQYVEVLWENIQDGMQEYNFNKLGYDDVDDLQVPYDYDSIMHYHSKMYSKNKQDTIRPIRSANNTLGQRTGFSAVDIREINTLYDC